MKRSRYSPASASMICSSRPVPRVTVTSAWVSPRVNSAEPWVRGSTPTRTVIGRTVRVSRPSMRGSPSRIWLRTIFDSRLKNISFTALASSGVPVAAASAASLSSAALRISPRRVLRACFCLMAKASRNSCSQLGDARDQRLVLGRRLPVPRRLAGLLGELDGSPGSRPASARGRTPRRRASTSSGSSSASDSTIITPCSVPATTRLSSRFLQLGGGRVDHVLAVHVADAAGADRAVERDAGDLERRGHRQHRRDVGVDFRVERQHRRHDLHFVEEAVREQRPDRPVDEARGQRLLLRSGGLRA